MFGIHKRKNKIKNNKHLLFLNMATKLITHTKFLSSYVVTTMRRTLCVSDRKRDAVSRSIRFLQRDALLGLLSENHYGRSKYKSRTQLQRPVFNRRNVR